MATVIEADKLTRDFGALRAVDELSLAVEEGEVFGVLGPNGAGKTTTVRLLNGVLRPTGGTVRVMGLDPGTQGSQVRQRTGVLTETPSLYERLTAKDNLEVWGALYGVPSSELDTRVSDMLGFLGLADRANERTGGYSKGMKQRLALARALIHDPDVLFLDEPTAALDPEAARQVSQYIEQLSHQRGRTVFLCTHNLAEAERLCDRVAVLNRGHLLAVGTLAELEHTLWRGTWLDVELREPLAEEELIALRAVPGVMDVQLPQPAARLAVQLAGRERVPAIIAALVAQGGQIMRANPRQHTLEDIYFELQDQQKDGQP
jgi:ABC-2 type transport system ATP-binding protein